MILMHKDIPVAEVSVIGNSITSVKKIYNREHLPTGVYSEFPSIMNSFLGSWQKMRTIPYNRENIEDVVKIIGCSVTEASLLCHFVSLTDCYWIKDENSSLSWRDVNFYDNPFTNKFADHFLCSLPGTCGDIRTPDFTTDGVLPKVWTRFYDIPYLIKFGGVKAANEVVASKIAKLCGVNHVEYLPIFIGEQMACISSCFIKDNNTEFVNLLQLQKEYKVSEIGLYQLLCDFGLQKETDEMIRFINLIHNTDCHQKNAGILRNADTLEITGFVPLFDSGTCLGADKAADMKPFLSERNAQLQLAKHEILLPEPTLVRGIIEETYKTFRLDENTLQTALSDLENTYKEIDYDFHSVQER